ncbi:tyrosine-type recombinase/integrase [Streptomyces xanthophaeus]
MASRATIEIYTSRHRRHTYAEPGEGTQFQRAVLLAAPAARPEVAPAPFGDLSLIRIEEFCALVTELLRGRNPSVAEKRRSGIRALFGYLETLPGTTWQERWDASVFKGEEAQPVNVLAPPGSTARRNNLVAAVKLAFCMRIIQPCLSGFRANRFPGYAEQFRLAQDDPRLDAFFEAAGSHPRLSTVHQDRAKFDVTCALTTQGIALEDLTPAVLLHYSVENKRLGLTHGACNQDRTRYAARGAWEVLHGMGHFPSGTAPTLRKTLSQGQYSVEELVGRYGIQNAEVRQLLIDYLLRRKSDTDYTTLDGLSRQLASIFWATIERINPDQADLALRAEVYDQWRAEIQYWQNDKSKVRMDVATVLLTVRGLYMDLHTWAVSEPERWARWVAPCPILPRDLKGFGKRRREIYRRMADRTRVRQPLLPVLVEHVESRHEQLSSLLEAARTVPLGTAFVHRGRHYTRSDSPEDRRRIRTEAGPTIRIVDQDTGKTIRLDQVEELAFWEWAAVEILRHSGIRIEELTELTHLSVRQYQRPNGEVIALLVIAPSKGERERVIPMSPDLFHAIAQVVRRQTRNQRAIPLVSRYDPQERLWSDPMPFLFQRQLGTAHAVLATATVNRMLKRSCNEIARTNPAFADARFTPHDFRRLFATEIVNGGLPIHIGAALLGHLNLQTTQGYVAVFAEDIVQQYQQFLNHRRAVRPEGEYLDVTPEEWAEFEEHFDKRKVELGNCARPYGSPCQHEHACIRCPMLRVNPKMLPRLTEIEKDLILRRKRAEDEQWLGELEGIDMTLTFIRTKQADAARLTHRPPVPLGIPTTRRPE